MMRIINVSSLKYCSGNTSRFALASHLVKFTYLPDVLGLNVIFNKSRCWCVFLTTQWAWLGFRPQSAKLSVLNGVRFYYYIFFRKRVWASKRLLVNCTAAAGASTLSTSICCAVPDQSRALAGRRTSCSTWMEAEEEEEEAGTEINNGGENRATFWFTGTSCPVSSSCGAAPRWRCVKHRQREVKQRRRGASGYTRRAASCKKNDTLKMSGEVKVSLITFPHVMPVFKIDQFSWPLSSCRSLTGGKPMCCFYFHTSSWTVSVQP